VDVAADSTLWSGTFDRGLRDIFDVQDEVGRAIVRALQLTLRVEHQARLVRRATRDIEAYTLYLQSLSAPSGSDAIQYLEAATQRDPNFAPAYVELAANWSLLAQWGRMLPREGYAKARAAALRAISLDSTLSEAHMALGRVMADHDWDWQGAEMAYRRALALNPSDATARSAYAFLLSETGRVAEAVAQRRQAVLLQPLGDPTGRSGSAAVELFYARRYDEAIEDVLANFPGDSTHPWRNWQLGRTYEQKGMLKEALASHEKAVAAARDNAIYLGALGHVYGIAGRRGDALKMARELEARAADAYVPGPAIALVYTGLGDTDGALQWLERGYEQRDRWMVFLKVEPRFDPLRTDPRFADLLRRMRLE
jgi:tetratricopeptide (TPR) repeat protein